MLVVFSGVFGVPIMVFGVFEFKRGINAEQMAVSSVHRGTAARPVFVEAVPRAPIAHGFLSQLNSLWAGTPSGWGSRSVSSGGNMYT